MHHAGDYLLVAKYNDGTWKIDEKDPKKMEQVAIAEKLPNADGMLLTGDGELVVVQNGDVNRVVRLKSTDGFKTAKVDKVVADFQGFSDHGGCGSRWQALRHDVPPRRALRGPGESQVRLVTLMELKF